MLSEVEEIICETQGRIYEYIANHNMDVPSFSREYLCSDFCKRAMDTTYSRFQWEEEGQCLSFILPEITAKETETPVPPEEAFWIGFTYRQMYIETGIPSRMLCREIPFEDMRQMYPGMHTITDENLVAIKIAENHGWRCREENDDQEPEIG